MKKIIGLLVVVVAMMAMMAMFSCSPTKTTKMQDPKVTACKNVCYDTFKQCNEDAGDDVAKKTACDVAKKECVDKCIK